MRVQLVCVVTMLLVVGCGPKREQPDARFPLCFVEETADKQVFEKIGRIHPIKIDDVLLFPVVEDGMINGVSVHNGLGSPIRYIPGSPILDREFPGVTFGEHRRFLAIVRGYYPVEVPRVFFYTDIINGQRNLLIEVTPLSPKTDEGGLTSALLSELRKKAIDVGPEVNLSSSTDYGAIVRAGTLKSWIEMPVESYHKSFVVWGRAGTRVQVFLTEDDLHLIELYLHPVKAAAPVKADARN